MTRLDAATTSRRVTYLLELDLELQEDTPNRLVESVLPVVLEHSTAKEAIDTGLFGADDHLNADVVGLRLLDPKTLGDLVDQAIDDHAAYALDDEEQDLLVAMIVAAIIERKP